MIWRLVLLACGVATAVPSFAELRYVVIVARHGVRSPTGTRESLGAWSAEPWPDWAAAPGLLTPHGEKLLRILGAWYRADLAKSGLVHSSGCGDASSIYIRADSDQRSRASAQAWTDGMFVGCRADLHALDEGEEDPLFSGATPNATPPAPRVALAAVLGRIGESPRELAALYQRQFAELEKILGKSLGSAPIAIAPGKGDNLIEITGPLRTASTLTEDLLLES